MKLEWSFRGALPFWWRDGVLMNAYLDGSEVSLWVKLDCGEKRVPPRGCLSLLCLGEPVGWEAMFGNWQVL